MLEVAAGPWIWRRHVQLRRPGEDRAVVDTPTPLVVFACRCRAHQSDPHCEWPNSVTMHEHRWAFCPSGEADGHEWEPIEPSSVDALRRAQHRYRDREAATVATRQRVGAERKIEAPRRPSY